jgi:hypothetical protein
LEASQCGAVLGCPLLVAIVLRLFCPHTLYLRA